MSGYFFGNGDMALLTQAQKYFIQLVAEVKAGIRKIEETPQVAQKQVVNMHEFGKAFLHDRRAKKQESIKAAQRNIDAGLLRYDQECRAREARLKGTPIKTVRSGNESGNYVKVGGR